MNRRKMDFKKSYWKERALRTHHLSFLDVSVAVNLERKHGLEWTFVVNQP